MENLPVYLPIFFGLITLIGIVFFYKATHYSKLFLLVLVIWMAFQTVLGLSGFYHVHDTFPPRFGLLVLPTIVLVIILFTNRKGRIFMDSLDIKTLTLFSVIRIPVEIALFLLAAQQVIPELMTFEGRNFDILSGLSAPVIWYLLLKNRINKALVLVWSFVCLALLLNVVFYALLSIPSDIQRFSFDQPNIAVEYFPFVFLPSVLVPLVLFSHLASIKQILKRSSQQKIQII